MCNYTEAMKKTYLMMRYETWNWKKIIYGPDV